MARKKAKASAVTQHPQGQIVYPPKPAFFPFARYTSIVGVHTTLLAFTALFLPQTDFDFFLTKSIPLQMTSADRPQHPFLQALTVNPLSTAMCVCAGTVILQAWWGGWVRNWAIDFAVEESHNRNKPVDARKFTMLRSAWSMTVLASFAVHVILVLFGAPITSNVPHTYLLAFLISLLTTFTPAYAMGVPSLTSKDGSLVNRLNWIRLFAEFSVRNPVERAIVYPAIGAVLGCWVGVFPIALDWDRPWQAWPLTPAFCAILGYILGSIIALFISATKFFADEHVRLKNQ